MCNDLRISDSGHGVVYVANPNKYVSNLFDLLESKGCLNCTSKYKCELLQILENNMC